LQLYFPVTSSPLNLVKIVLNRTVMTSVKRLFFLKTLSLLGLLAASSTCALADVTWDLTNVGFKDGATATGYFTTLGNTVTGFDDFLDLPNAKPTQAVTAVSSYLPGSIGFAFNSAFTEYIDLVFSSPIKAGTTSVSLKAGSNGSVLCPTPGGTCYFLTGNARLVDAPVPEPAAILLLGTICVLVFAKVSRRKLSRTV